MNDTLDRWNFSDDFIVNIINHIGIHQIGSEVPKDFSLSQNYPNPFNPKTRIRFDNPPSPLSERGDRGGFVRLEIYDILGREIAILINEKLNAGTYEVDFDGSEYPTGIYFYTLTSGQFTETRKMVLAK